MNVFEITGPKTSNTHKSRSKSFMLLSVNFICIFQLYTIVRFPYKTLYIYSVRRCQIIIFTALKELEKAVYRPLISYVDCNNCLQVGEEMWRNVDLLSDPSVQTTGNTPDSTRFSPRFKSFISLLGGRFIHGLSPFIASFPSHLVEIALREVKRLLPYAP